MTKMLIAVASVMLISCHSDETKEPETKATATETSSKLPYTATYSSKFEVGDSKNSETILKAWKSWDDGNLLTSRSFFADTMHFYFRDGNQMVGPTDSLLKTAQAIRDGYSSVKSVVHAYIPTKSTDKNDSWVCIWGTEISTDKQGKVDSVGLQETWRFNKDGKIDLLYQYGRALVPPSGSK